MQALPQPVSMYIVFQEFIWDKIPRVFSPLGEAKQDTKRPVEGSSKEGQIQLDLPTCC